MAAPVERGVNCNEIKHRASRAVEKIEKARTMSDFSHDDRLAALEQQTQLLVETVNSITNDKVPRISLRKFVSINNALSSLAIEQSIDDDSISDIEAAIYDARDQSTRATQEMRRLRSALDVHRFLLLAALKSHPYESVDELLGSAAEYVDGTDPGKIVTRYSGLEQRAAHKEIEALKSLFEILG